MSKSIKTNQYFELANAFLLASLNEFMSTFHLLFFKVITIRFWKPYVILLYMKIKFLSMIIIYHV